MLKQITERRLNNGSSLKRFC